VKVCPQCKGSGRIPGQTPRACHCLAGRSQARAGDSRGAKSAALWQLSEVVLAWREGRTEAVQVARVMVRARGAGCTPGDIELVAKLSGPELQTIMALVHALPQGRLF